MSVEDYPFCGQLRTIVKDVVNKILINMNEHRQ